MLFKIIISLLFVSIFSNAAIMEEGSLFKEKQELMEIKDELNSFYEAKELDYQRSKAELESIQKEIKIEELSVKTIRDENQKILDEIKRVISTKSMTMYDKMKLGVVVNIFKEMIKNGDINEVFDIMIRLKDKRIMKILKKLDTKTSTMLMKKMRILKEDENKNKEKK